MIYGIADHMKQGVFEMLQDTSVDFHIRTDDLQSCKFVVVLRNIANGTCELLKQRSHWNEAHSHDLFLQVLLQTFNLAMHFEDLAPGLSSEILDHASQTPLGNGDLSRQVQHVIQFVGVDSERAVPVTQ